MNKKCNKIVSLLVSISMFSFLVTGCQKKDSEVSTNYNEIPTTNVVNAATGDKLSKDETVYVLCGSDGSISKIIVSDWLKNGSQESTIQDKTNLSDIEVTKGETNYQLDNNKMTVWDANGGDVYYQGTSIEKLPVDMKVTYELDGKNISTQDLEGKSGKVKINYQFTNNTYQMVDVNGVQTKIYVPFTMLTGLMLDNQQFSNIKVSNGKIVNLGDSSIVMGFALPGMQENLNISDTDLELPTNIEIEADVKEFSFGSTMTLATNELFNELDLSNVENETDLMQSMSALTDGMAQLLDGSSQLYENLGLLLEKSDELVNGIYQIADAVSTLKTAGGSLYDGTVSLRDNLKTLENGLGELVKNNDTLNGGAKQVFNSLLTMANQQLNEAGLDQLGIQIPTLTIDNYTTVLEQLITSLDADKVYNAAYQKALDTVTKEVNAKEDEIKQGVISAVEKEVTSSVTMQVQANVKQQVTEVIKQQVTSSIQSQSDSVYQAAVYPTVLQQCINNGMSEEQAKNYLQSEAGINLLNQAVQSLTDEQKNQAVSTAIEQKMNSDDIQQMIKTNVNEQMNSDDLQKQMQSIVSEKMESQEIQSTIQENIAKQKQYYIDLAMSGDDVVSQIASAVAKVSEGASQIVTLKGSLDQYHVFYNGLLQYTNGVASVYQGSQQLSAGASTLADYMLQANDGLTQLDSAMTELKTKSGALPEGVSLLKDGSMQLSDGLKTFNEEGIQKLVNLVEGDLDGLVHRLKAIVDVSKSYNNFSGIADNMDGKVKFIYKTDEIGE